MKTKRFLLAVAAVGGLFTAMNPAFAQTWTRTSAPITNWSAVACSADRSRLVATVSGGGIYASTNLGATWVATGAPITNWCSVASSADGTKLVAAVGGSRLFGYQPLGPIYASVDSGATWMQTSAPITNWTSVAASADGSKIVAVGNGGSGIYTSTNFGAAWMQTSASAGDWTSVASSADGSKLIAVYPFTHSASADSGASWTEAGGPWYNFSVASSADGTRLLVGCWDNVHGQAPIYNSTNSGATWELTLGGLFGRGYVASSADGTKLVAASTGGGGPFGYGPGQIYISTNSALTWTLSDAPGAYWTSVATSADGSKLVAVVEGGGIYTSPATTPWIYVQPASQTVAAGSNVTFSLLAYGAEPLAYQWAVNGSVLPGATNASLTITNVGLSDSGAHYSTVVSNIFDRVSSSNALLTVFPLLLVTRPAYVISATSAMFYASITPGANPATVWFEWWADPSQVRRTAGANVDSGFTPTDFNFLVTNLSAATAYQYRAVASNILGTVVATELGFVTPYPPFIPTTALTNFWSSIASSADGTKWVATVASGGIYASTNSGATWTLTSAPTGAWTSVASSADGDKLVALLDGGLIYTSTNSGKTWVPASAPIGAWRSVASSADGSKLVAGTFGTDPDYLGALYTSTNSGISWTLTSAPTTNWVAVAGSADGSKLVAAALGTYPAYAGPLYRSTNSGATWSLLTNAPNNVFWRAVASSATGTKLVAALSGSGFPGPLFVSGDSGATWTATDVGCGPCQYWTSVATSADGTKMVAVASVIFTSPDSGATWTPNGAANANWRAVASSADGGQLAAAVAGGGIWISHTISTPSLGIVPAGSDALISWTVPSTDFLLQQNSELAAPNWTDLTNAPSLNLTNLRKEVVVSATNGNRFYRLGNRLGAPATSFKNHAQ